MSTTVFTLAIPIFERSIPYRLELNKRGELVSSTCLLNDLPPAAAKLIIGDDPISVEERIDLVGSMLPLAVSLWCLLGLSPAWAAGIAAWGKQRSASTPNLVGSPHPDTLFSDYYVEYYALGHAVNDVFSKISRPQQGIRMSLDSSWHQHSHPLFSALSFLTIPFIADTSDRVFACVCLLKHHTESKEVFVMDQAYGVWEKDHLPRKQLMSLFLHLKSDAHRSGLLLKMSSRQFLYTPDAYRRYRWGEEKWWPKLHNRYSLKIDDEDGGVLGLLKGIIPVSNWIDYAEKRDEWPLRLAKWFTVLQDFRKEDKRIPAPETYLQYIINQAVPTEPWHMESLFWGEVIRKFHHTVDFGNILSDLLESKDALRILHACFLYGTTYIEPVVHRTRTEDGAITATPQFASRPLLIRKSAISALLSFHLNPKIWARRYLGDPTAFDTLEFIALQQPEVLPTIVDALLDYIDEPGNDRYVQFLAILVNLVDQNYRSEDIITKVSNYLKQDNRISYVLKEAIVQTRHSVLEKLLIDHHLEFFGDEASSSLGLLAIERLQGFTDNYHRVPPTVFVGAAAGAEGGF